MAVADGLYDTALVEKVPGEGFIEFHLRLAGALELTLPGVAAPVAQAARCGVGLQLSVRGAALAAGAGDAGALR